MSGPVDTRAMRGFNPIVLPLNQGLDLSGSLASRPPGSLRECLNVEVLNGNLQTIPTPAAVGAGRLTEVPWGDIWLLETSASNYSVTGSYPNLTPAYVEWFHNSGSYTNYSPHPAGSGYINYSNLGGYGDSRIFWITHTKGLPPSGSDRFEWSSGELTITGSAEFTNIEFPSDKLTSGAPDWPSLHALRTMFLSMTTIWPSGSGTLSSGYYKVPGYGPVTHVFGHSKAVYAVRDFLVGRFENGSQEMAPGSYIYLNDGVTAHYAKVIWQERRQGSYFDGDAAGYLYLAVDDSYGYDSFAEIDALHENWMDTANYTIHDAATTTQIAINDTNVGTYTNASTKRHGLMWKCDISAEGNGEKWYAVDLGYSCHFDGGLVNPNLTEGPLIPSDSIPYLKDTGWVATDSVSNLSSAPTNRVNFTSTSNMTADDATYATCVLTGTDVGSGEVRARISHALPDGAKIVGIEVAIEAKVSAGSTTTLDNVYIVATGGTNSGTTAVNMARYYSENKAVGDVMTASDVKYTFGSSTDTWGLDYLTAEDITSMYVEFWFNDTGGASPTISVDVVEVKFHYLSRQQRLYFYDGSTDLANAEGYAIQVHDGDWSTDDAEGWITLHDYTSTTWPVPDGTQIRTAASGAGDLIGYVREIKPNILPASFAMENRSAIAHMRNGVISDEVGAEKVYVVNGVSPAFSMDWDDKFQFIRTPVDRIKDCPRYVEIIPGHLILGLDEHIFISSIGNDNNFSTFDGATTWSLNDTIKGMQRMPDNTVVIGAAKSIHRLAGSAASGSDPFNVKHISSSRGVKANSLVLADDLYFLTEGGISGLSTSDKFGDFDGGALSAHIDKYLLPRIRNRRATEGPTNVKGRTGGAYSDTDAHGQVSRGFVGAIPMRRRNQIWYFFNDSDILVATLPASDAPQQQRIEYTVRNFDANVGNSLSTYTKHFVYVGNVYRLQPSALCSFVTQTGIEWALQGTPDGNVIRLDTGPHFTNGYFSTNPVTGDAHLGTALQVESASLTVEHEVGHNIIMTQQADLMPPVWWGSGYFSDTTQQKVLSTAYDQDASGATKGYYFGESSVQRMTLYDQGISQGFSWGVGVNGGGYHLWPVRFHNLSVDASARAYDKAFNLRPVIVGGDVTRQDYDL